MKVFSKYICPHSFAIPIDLQKDAANQNMGTKVAKLNMGARMEKFRTMILSTIQIVYNNEMKEEDND